MSPNPPLRSTISTINRAEDSQSLQGLTLTSIKQFHVTIKYLIISLSLWITACSNDYTESFPAGEELTTNSSLRELRAQFRGNTVRIESDIVIAGRVTSSDREGNFYRSLMIEQDGAAAEVMVGLDALHNDYPIGTKIYLRLRDLAVGERLGVLQIGHMPAPSSWYATDYLRSKADVDQHLIRSASPIAELYPTTLRIDELTPAHCGLLVRIEGVRFIPDVEPHTWSGYRCFADNKNALIYTYVRNYADFADEAIPSGFGSLVGILQYDETGAGKYIIKPRNAHDFIP